MNQPDASSELLGLADWRRQVADLYAEVRRLAASDPAAAWHCWREERDRLYRRHPQSPVPPVERASFTPRYFPYDPALRFELPVTPAPAPAEGDRLALPTSSGGAMAFQHLGWLDVPFPAGERRLALFWMAGYAGGLFLPFRDATSGQETYGAGRYLLDAAKSADLGGSAEPGVLLLDFNFAYQPSCAFDPRWLCPLSPPENRLDLAIRAGERLRSPRGSRSAAAL